MIDAPKQWLPRSYVTYIDTEKYTHYQYGVGGHKIAT